MSARPILHLPTPDSQDSFKAVIKASITYLDVARNLLKALEEHSHPEQMKPMFEDSLSRLKFAETRVSYLITQIEKRQPVNLFTMSAACQLAAMSTLSVENPPVLDGCYSTTYMSADTTTSVTESTIGRQFPNSVKQSAKEAAMWARERGGPIKKAIRHQEGCNYLLFATECECDNSNNMLSEQDDTLQSDASQLIQMRL